MEFTPKRRLLASIKGQQVDHVPFSPFLAYYFDFLPTQTQEKGELAYLEEIGADPLFRGAHAGQQFADRGIYLFEKSKLVVSDETSGEHSGGAETVSLR